jgi:nicotinamidase-related amidase
VPVDLAVVAGPGRSAVLTMEIQRGVIGDLSSFPQLAEAAARVGVVPNTARLVRAARAAGVPVVHCTAEFRADRRGSTVNCQLIAAMVRNPEHLLEGTAPVEIVHELGPEPGDMVCSRLHGVSPFSGTALDAWLRSLGVGTVVATGVSVNLGVLGLAIEACNLGYQVVVPRDTVAGLPDEYADAVLDNTFPLIATLTTTDALLDAWAGASGVAPRPG